MVNLVSCYVVAGYMSLFQTDTHSKRAVHDLYISSYKLQGSVVESS